MNVYRVTAAHNSGRVVARLDIRARDWRDAIYRSHFDGRYPSWINVTARKLWWASLVERFRKGA